ncbi:MAG TPA: exopolysaccharide Pel transporter PelG [Beijerinckiaceae bacterium]
MAGVNAPLETWLRGASAGPGSPVASGVVATAGPWLFSVAAMLAVQRATDAAGLEASGYAFRAAIVYAFCWSMLVAAPIACVMARRFSDALRVDQAAAMETLYERGLTLCILLPGASAAPLFAGFGLGVADVAAAAAACAALGGVWFSLSICSALRDYRAVSMAFAIGLTVGAASTLAAIGLRGPPGLMLAAFGLGLVVTLARLAGSVRRRLDETAPAPAAPLPRGRHGVLALGGALAVAVLWADKWVTWSGPFGAATSNGLLYSPLYDGAMFVAYLSLLPALCLFFVFMESAFLPAYKDYLRALEGHATLDVVTRKADDLRAMAHRALARILITQAAVAGLVILTAPDLAPAAGLQYQQIGVLRLGVVAALLQFVFLTASSLLVFFDRAGPFAALQACGLALQAGLTWAVQTFAPDAIGYGHLLACAASAVLATHLLERTLTRLPFLTFRSAWRLAAAPAPRTPRRRRLVFPAPAGALATGARP